MFYVLMLMTQNQIQIQRQILIQTLFQAQILVPIHSKINLGGDLVVCTTGAGDPEKKQRSI